jgi:hypothetical protein
MNQSQLSKEEKLSTIIELCNDIEIDGETMEYVLRAIGMEDQMLRQLVMKANSNDVTKLLFEKLHLSDIVDNEY